MTMWADSYLDVVGIRAFYDSRLGAVATRLIGEGIARLWPSAT